MIRSKLKSDLAQSLSRFPSQNPTFADIWNSAINEELLNKTDIAIIQLREIHNIYANPVILGARFPG